MNEGGQQSSIPKENTSSNSAQVNQLVKLAILISGLGLILFLIIVFTFPFKHQLLSLLYPKPEIEAAEPFMVTAGSTISVPISFSASEEVSAADFTVLVTGGILGELTCGGSGFEDTGSSAGSRCVIFNPDGSIGTTIATVIVTIEQMGVLEVSVTGTLSTPEGVAPASWSLEGVNYQIVTDVLVGDVVSAPITFTASDSVTAADFTVLVTGGALVDLVCGGSRFLDAGNSSGSRCIVFYPDGSTEGTIASAFVSASQVGTLTISVDGQLSTENGIPPASGELSGASYVVVSPSPSVTPPTSTPTLVPPTLTPTPIPPTPTPAGGNLTVVPDVSQTQLGSVTISGTKWANTSIWFNEVEVISNNSAMTWNYSAPVALGSNGLVFVTKDAQGMEIGSVTVEVTRYGLGDVSGDGRVDVFDLGIFAGNYGTVGITSENLSQLRLCDLRQDGKIDVFDLGILAGVYGDTYNY